MYETAKANRRRARDPQFARYFVGDGIDIGCGPDPLTKFVGFWPFLQSVDEWDLDDGDAQYMENADDESYDFVYSSHTLEHMRDPAVALHHWFRILKPGGYLIVTVPDEDLYEQGVWPPRFNTDHKNTFTVMKRPGTSWSPVSQNMAELLAALDGDIIKIERIVENFRDDLPNHVDQTSQWIAECCIECIVRKPVTPKVWTQDHDDATPNDDHKPERPT